MRGAILVAGTSSDAGKSVVVAGICRLARRGVRVAPFKAQNMSLNSAVTPGGAEIGRAQAAQAQAAGAVPEAVMNPILLKPASEQSSQVVVLGRPLTVANGPSYLDLRRELLPVVLRAFESLRSRFDVVVCEGAGSLAEPNLRAGDLANMGLARAVGLPVVVVADVDRGGAFAGLFGCLAVLDGEDQALIGGFLLNRFRGDRGILSPALDWLQARTARPVLGVFPWVRGLWLDAEDSVDLEARREEPLPPLGRDALGVAVVRLPRISNFTDLDALACEPGVMVRFTHSPAEVLKADLAVLPGTKATVEDLSWLRSRGLDGALKARAARGDPVIGICGGYQMLGRRIVDGVESGAGEVEALGLLPVETVFAPDKLLRRSEGTATCWANAPVAGYEIRHGRVRRLGGEALIHAIEEDEGCREGTIFGTSWHGAFEGDEFRRAFLRSVAEVRGLDWVPGSRSFAEVREARLDRLGDLVERHADTDLLVRLIEDGPPRGLPAIDVRIGTHPARDTAPDRRSSAPGPASPDLRLHGDRMVRSGDLDFAVNVVPGGPAAGLKEELAAALDRVSSYPDQSEAAAALAERHGRSPDEVLPLNGAAEAFWLLAAGLRPRRAVVVHPTFTEPEVALRAHGRPLERVFRDQEDFFLDPHAIPEEADLVVVCNPNNPTGNLDSAPVLEGLARPTRVLVVDEAFMEFSPGEPESLAGRSDLPGLVVIRSLTKAWSIPGIRAGYLLGQAGLVDTLGAVRQPWAVNVLACAALAVCAGDRETPRRVAEEVGRARETLAAALAELPGARVWRSTANFLLVRVPDGPAVRTALLERGVAVRRADTFPGLGPDHLRLAVRGPAENELLLKALREVLR